jgi:hypothetical protein
MAMAGDGRWLGALAILTAWGGLVGCAPKTELAAGGPDAPGGSGSAAAGTLIDPIAGASQVPLNLAAVTVRFSGPVTVPEGALRVCGGVPVGPLAPAACDAGTCYSARLTARLPARSSCRVELGAGATNDAGSPLAGGLIGVFDTADEVDDTPPAISAVTIQSAGPCVAVTFATDEPTTATVLLRAGDVESEAPAGAGQSSFELAVPLSALPAEAAATVTVRAVDRAGNLAESAPLAFQTPPAVPPVAITEVLANPAGPEPAQEFVELRNLGADPVSLEGLSVGDSRGADALPAELLGPGAYALVVTSAYDPTGMTDPAPRAGTLLLRVDGRLGTDGLSNGGEVTRLLRGDAVVSSYGGWVNVSSSTWSGRAVHRLVATACDRPAAWNRAPLEPTPGWGPP